MQFPGCLYPVPGSRHYKSSSLITLVGLGIKLLGTLNHQFRDLCTARALSGLSEEWAILMPNEGWEILIFSANPGLKDWTRERGQGKFGILTYRVRVAFGGARGLWGSRWTGQERDRPRQWVGGRGVRWWRNSENAMVQECGAGPSWGQKGHREPTICFVFSFVVSFINSWII